MLKSNKKQNDNIFLKFKMVSFSGYFQRAWLQIPTPSPVRAVNAFLNDPEYFSPTAPDKTQFPPTGILQSNKAAIRCWKGTLHTLMWGSEGPEQAGMSYDRIHDKWYDMTWHNIMWYDVAWCDVIWVGFVVRWEQWIQIA